ncbi:uncharacterized protein [Periplaneta americana]
MSVLGADFGNQLAATSGLGEPTLQLLLLQILTQVMPTGKKCCENLVHELQKEKDRHKAERARWEQEVDELEEKIKVLRQKIVVLQVTDTTPTPGNCADLPSAVRTCNLESVQKLVLQNCTMVDSTPMHLAAEVGCVPAVDWLSRNRTGSVDALDHAGVTPLYKALANQQVNVALLLMQHGANIENQFDIDWTSLLNQEHDRLVSSLLNAFQVTDNTTAVVAQP